MKQLSHALIVVLVSIPITGAAEAANFFVDHPAIYRTALSAALKEYPEVSKDDLVLASDSLMFSCSSSQHFRPESLCNISIGFIVKSTWKVSKKPAEVEGYCELAYRYQGIDVTIYSDGSANTEMGTAEPVGTDRCDRKTEFYTVDELIQSYQQAAHAASQKP